MGYHLIRKWAAVIAGAAILRVSILDYKKLSAIENTLFDVKEDFKNLTATPDGSSSRSSGVFLIPDAPTSVPLPSLLLTCRLTSRFANISKRTLLRSFQTFWPQPSAWPTASLAMIWDQENEKDYEASRTFPPYVKHFFEPEPANGTLCGWMRGTGYDRQQYSNFVQDRLFFNHSDDNVPEFLGFLDADSFFTAAAHPSELFDWDGQRWKPRVIGYNSCCVGWSANTAKVLGTQAPVGQFMVVIGFPIIVKTKHLAYIRSRVSQNLLGKTGDSAFDETFHQICSISKAYSQFDIMMNILWHSPYRDEYSWTIRDQANSHHDAFQTTLSNDSQVLARNDFHADIPKLGIMHHHQAALFGRKGSEEAFKAIGEIVDSAICLYKNNDDGTDCLDPSLQLLFCQNITPPNPNI